MIKNILLTMLPALAFFPLSLRADAAEPNPGARPEATIRVSGYGSVQVKPDMATITTGVTTDGADPQTALSQNAAATAKILSELEAAGVQKKDLQTSNFSIYSQLRSESDSKRQTLVYRVTNTVAVTVRSLDKIGDILGKVVAAGSNQIGGPSFSTSSPDQALREARKRAVQDALDKAQTFAAAAGLSLGPVVDMSDDVGTPGPLFRGPSATMSRMLDAPPIEAGQETIDAKVVMTFSLTAK